MNYKFSGATIAGAADAFKAFDLVINSINIWLAEEQKTQQVVEEVRARRDTTISAIEAQRDFLLRSLDLVFDERRTAFRELFARLDDAMRVGSESMVADVLSSITTLATQNPFAELRDHRIVIQQFQTDAEWEV